MSTVGHIQLRGGVNFVLRLSHRDIISNLAKATKAGGATGGGG